VKDNPKSNKMVGEAIEVNRSQTVPDWLKVSSDSKVSEILAIPRREHVPHPIQEQLIIELCSK
jgi:ribosomal protein S4